MLHESAFSVFKQSPLVAAKIPVWLKKGKANLKKHLAESTDFNPKTLPYNEEFIGWLKDECASGRKLILCTASDSSIAIKIAEHLGIFDGVIASDGNVNVAGQRKADILVERFGASGFDYAGNSSDDLFVWESARHAIVVNATARIAKKANECFEVEKVFHPRQTTPLVWLQVLRAHHWLKNLLVFIPLFAAHEIFNLQNWSILIIALICFCFVHPLYTSPMTFLI